MNRFRHDSMLPPVGALDTDALTVAMAVAPGVYSRNRFFHLHKVPEMRRARSRAAVLRGIVQHLVTMQHAGTDVASAVGMDRHGGRVRLVYRMPALRFERSAVLSELEASCFLYLAERAGLTGFFPSQGERDGLHAALRRLSGGEAAMLLR
jgi:hypothetical protein